MAEKESKTDKEFLTPELCNNNTELSESIYNKIESSAVSILQLLLLLEENTYNNGELCNKDTELFKVHFLKWIEIFKKPEYLKIIYYLICNGICHASGLTKVFGGDIGNISKQLSFLVSYGIIEECDKGKDIQLLFTHRKAFRLDNWHFNKATFFKLTKLGNKVYFKTPFKKFLSHNIMQTADKWKERLCKTHDSVKKESFKIRDIKEEWYLQFVNYVKNGIMNFPPTSWMESKIKNLQEHKGLIIEETPEKLLSDFKKKFELNKKKVENGIK